MKGDYLRDRPRVDASAAFAHKNPPPGAEGLIARRSIKFTRRCSLIPSFSCSGFCRSHFSAIGWWSVIRPAWRLPLLVLLSFVFYGYWDWRFLPLLAFSILRQLDRRRELHQRPGARSLIPLAIARQSGRAGGLQVFQFLRRSGEPHSRPERAALRHRAAARHLVLHLPSHHVPDGSEGRQGAALRSRPLRALYRRSSRRFSPGRWCAGARSCTSSTSGPICAPTPPSASRAG